MPQPEDMPPPPLTERQKKLLDEIPKINSLNDELDRMKGDGLSKVHHEEALGGISKVPGLVKDQHQPTEIEGQAQAEMPRYKCHKVVWALQIKAVLNAVDGSHCSLEVECGFAPIRVENEWVMRHNPQPGGYYVVYDDGYKSYSPAAAFEAGYTRTREFPPGRPVQPEEAIPVGVGFREHHWNDHHGNPEGGISWGIGFTIAWQRGPLGRGPNRLPPNGAFVENVIKAVIGRIEYYEMSRFSCNENQQAIIHLEKALDALESRTSRREAAQTEGTHAGH